MALAQDRTAVYPKCLPIYSPTPVIRLALFDQFCGDTTLRGELEIDLIAAAILALNLTKRIFQRMAALRWRFNSRGWFSAMQFIRLSCWLVDFLSCI
jgi:hypothetical protein